MSQIQRYQYTLGANEEVNPSIPQSNFIRCTSGSGVFTVYPSDLSPLVLSNGLGAKFTQLFNTVRIKNGATPQTIELYIGQGDIDDSRLSVSGGIPTAGNAGATYGAVSVGTTATVIRTANTNRASCLVQNLGSAPMYLGTDASVTTANGLEVGAGSSATLTFQSAIYGIVASGSNDVRFIEETS